MIREELMGDKLEFKSLGEVVDYFNNEHDKIKETIAKLNMMSLELTGLNQNQSVTPLQTVNIVYNILKREGLLNGTEKT